MNAPFTVTEDSKGTCCLMLESTHGTDAVVILTLKDNSRETANELAAHLNEHVRAIKVETIKSE